MQNELVAAAVVSPLSCPQCHLPNSEEWISRHICLGCGFPQPVSSEEDYFNVLGVSRQFGVDRAELERRFYRASRALHPDRFTTQGKEAQAVSLKRMSLLNEAYRVLKSPALLRKYFLELEGIKSSSQASFPDLAEAWFEIQDEIQEVKEKDRIDAVLNDFQSKLSLAGFEAEKKLASLEASYDLQPSREILEKIALEIQKQSYLNSMVKDAERVRKNADSN